MRGVAAEGIFWTALVLQVFCVWVLFRTLRVHPAPALALRSLRRVAAVTLETSRLARWRRWLSGSSSEQARSLAWYVLLFSLVYGWGGLRLIGIQVPEIGIGPFGDSEASTDFIQTLWQVVAAAVGLTVAMISFAFEVFIGSRQGQQGGSLRDFSRRTGLLIGIRLGVLALFLDGAVLLNIGTEAPAGWAALWATLISAITLLWVLIVIERTILGLGPQRLLNLRFADLRRVVESSLRLQLLSQAAEVVIETQGPLLRRRLFGGGEGFAIDARQGGVVRNVWLGPLARIAASSDQPIELAVGLGARVSPGTELLTVPAGLSSLQRALAARCVRIAASEDAPEQDLDAQLARLHGIAGQAIREHQLEEWREVGRLYEDVLLALPRAAQKYGLPFTGAVAAPGFFGHGPMQKISSNLRDEMRLAVRVEDDELAEAIAYLPLRISNEAASLGALAVSNEMLGLYPTLFVISKEGTTP